MYSEVERACPTTPLGGRGETERTVLDCARRRVADELRIWFSAMHGQHVKGMKPGKQGRMFRMRSYLDCGTQWLAEGWRCLFGESLEFQQTFVTC